MSSLDGAAQPDYTPLITPLSQAEVAAFRQGSRESGAPWVARPDPTGQYSGSVWSYLVRLLPLVPPLLVIFLLVTVIGPQLPGLIRTLIELIIENPFPFGLVSFAVAAVALLIFGTLIASFVRLVRGLGYPRGWWEAAIRLTRFAAANGLVYGHEQTVPFQGAIFVVGENRAAERRLSSAGGRLTEIGNYRCDREPRQRW